MAAIKFPPRPQSPPLDENGNWRPEWVQYLAAMDAIVRRLNT